MASRWQKDAKQLVNAAQRLVLVGDHLPVISSDQDCSRAGVSRHKHACGLRACWTGQGLEPVGIQHQLSVCCIVHSQGCSKA